MSRRRCCGGGSRWRIFLKF
uniref:Uncharacterized protein n=1 Tax=Arundo donax TaxID=35708 RepID=A0A0A9I473_ARUDO